MLRAYGTCQISRKTWWSAHVFLPKIICLLHVIYYWFLFKIRCKALKISVIWSKNKYNHQSHLHCFVFPQNPYILPISVYFTLFYFIYPRKNYFQSQKMLLISFPSKIFFFTVPFPSNSHHTITSIYFTVFMFILPRCSQMPALKLFSDHKHPSAFFSIQNNIFCS